MIKDCQNYYIHKHDYSPITVLTDSQVLRDCVFVQFLFFFQHNNSRMLYEVLPISKRSEIMLSTHAHVHSFSRLFIIKIGNLILFSFVLYDEKVNEREQQREREKENKFKYFSFSPLFCYSCCYCFCCFC
jgi:hypothetical protein